jgi:hypothetical protein
LHLFFSAKLGADFIKLGEGRKAQSASKIWEKMQKVERKVQMHDTKLE